MPITINANTAFVATKRENAREWSGEQLPGLCVLMHFLGESVNNIGIGTLFVRSLPVNHCEQPQSCSHAALHERGFKLVSTKQSEKT